MERDRSADERFAEKVLGWECRTYPDGLCPEIKHWYVWISCCCNADSRCRYSATGAAVSEPKCESCEALREALTNIENWSRAYPVDVFPEPDMGKCRSALGDSLFARLNAHSMRHVAEGMGRIASAALDGEHTPRGQEEK